MFAQHCQRTRGPLHAAWDKRRRHFVANAGHEAARYLMNGVQMIVLRTKNSGPSVARNIVLLPKSGKVSGEGPERVFSSETVSADIDLIQQAEDKMVRQVKGEIDSFIMLAPTSRAKKAIERLLATY